MKAIVLILAALTLTGCDRISFELYSHQTMETCEKLVRADVAKDTRVPPVPYSTYFVMKCYNERMDAYVDHGIEYDENSKIKAVKRSY